MQTVAVHLNITETLCDINEKQKANRSTNFVAAKNCLTGCMHPRRLCDYYDDNVHTANLLQVRRISQGKRKSPEY